MITVGRLFVGAPCYDSRNSQSHLAIEPRGAHGVHGPANRGGSPTVEEGTLAMLEPSLTVALLPRAARCQGGTRE